MTTRPNQYEANADPVRIGVVIDLPEGYATLIMQTYNLVIEELAASRRFERGIELVVATPFGPPAGFIDNTIAAYHRLCDDGCVAVIGFFNSDDCIAMAEQADARRVPAIVQGATARGMSEWSFSVGWSSIPHDAYCVAGWLKANGYSRVALTWDRAHHAQEYVDNFRTACNRAGLRILTDIRFPQLLNSDLSDIFASAVAELRSLRPDALAHFGTGWVATHWARFVNQSGWQVPRIMNDAFYGAATEEYVEWYEGWAGTTTWDDDNSVTAQLGEAFARRYPDVPSPPREGISVFRDGMCALIEGIISAPIVTPDGVRRGLESVHQLPSACGGPRTAIGFGRYAHRGHQGADVMVVRRVENGQLVMDSRIDLF